MLTREKLGYLPGSMDLAYLSQDLDELRAAVQSGAFNLGVLLEICLECEREAKRLGVPDVIAQTLIERARILLAHREYAEAIRLLREAEQQLRDLREYDLKVKIYGELAEAHAALGEWEKLSDVCETGIGIVEPLRYDVSGQYLQSGYLRSRIGLYSRGVQAAYEMHRYPVMMERAELSKCRSVLRRRADRPNARSKMTPTRRAFQNVCEQIDAARAKNVEAEKIAPLLSKRRMLWDLVLIERGQAELPKFDLDAVQSLLGAGEAVLYYYWIDSNNLLIALIDREGISAMTRRITDEKRTALDQFCQDILARLNPNMPGFLNYLNSLPDFAPELLPDKIAGRLGKVQRLLISPHLFLHAFPFHALPWNEQTPFLIQRFTITYVPNLRSLLVPYQAPARPCWLILGICDYEVPGHTLVPLPDAEQEARELERLFAARGIEFAELIGRKASREMLRYLQQKGKLGAFTGLHVATHGQNVNSDTPMESYLFLNNSLLEALEIADWQLKAELVILSACSSGQRAIKGRGTAEVPGDDLFGLQAAFFAAGAKRVIGSLWPVDSAATRPMMASLHRHLANGHIPEIALRSAILESIESDPAPFYWAPFFVSAVGRPVRAD